MCLYDAVIVDAERFAESVLRDLETAVDVTAESAREVEADRKGQIIGAQGGQQRGPLWCAGKGDEDLLTDERFVGSGGSRQQATAVDGGILMVEAGWNRQNQCQPIGRDDRIPS